MKMFRFPLLCALLVLLLPGCVTQQDKIAAMTDVNREFQRHYERTLADIGTRVFDVPKARAFPAMRSTFEKLGFGIVEEDPVVGYIYAKGPAPSPLDRGEWAQATESDLVLMRQIVSEHVGVMASAAKFEPDTLDVVVNALVLEIPGGVEISATMRLKERTPPQTGFPHREYPPPAAFRRGLEKIWATFQRELRLIGGYPG